jgi:hypothetical protein
MFGDDIAEFTRFCKGHWVFVVEFFKVLVEPFRQVVPSSKK